ncbi:MAG TPA: hypothetical protein VM840_06205 [Actinomycetota bacterium]|nr:hypothetical protein [Actinomycetota bacterium]
MSCRVLIASGMLLASLAAPAPPAQASDVVPACRFTQALDPGVTIQKSCLVVNPARANATAFTFVDGSSIRVYDTADGNREITGRDREDFLKLLRIGIRTQRILVSGDRSDGEFNDQDVAPAAPPGEPRTRQVCDVALTELTWDEQTESSACRIGLLRAAGTPFFHREYLVQLTMLSEGYRRQMDTWGFSFTEVQRVRVPASRDCGVAWTCEPAPLGLYTR